MLDREEERARERVAELDRRLTQFAADIAREQQQTSDAEVALQRLDTEDAELKDEIKSRVEKRSGVDERVSEAEATLAAAERLFAELTTALADLTAKRNQLEAGVRTHRDRLARLDQEIANVQPTSRNWRRRPAVSATSLHSPRRWRPRRKPSRNPKPPRKREAGHVDARAAARSLPRAAQRGRQARAAARDRSRTISKLVNGESKNLWPPIIDGITVDKGYEKAIGAVLGDDLDAPVDPSAPMRWTNAGVTEGDPALPDGVESLAAHVEAPPELARRLAQIGVVAEGARRRAGVAIEDRPVAGVAGRRRLALGRLCRRGPCADRRGAPSRRTRPAGRYRERTRAGPHRRLWPCARRWKTPKPN